VRWHAFGLSARQLSTLENVMGFGKSSHAGGTRSEHCGQRKGQDLSSFRSTCRDVVLVDVAHVNTTCTLIMKRPKTHVHAHKQVISAVSWDDLGATLYNSLFEIEPSVESMFVTDRWLRIKIWNCFTPQFEGTY
jgi:hypothetical protein